MPRKSASRPAILEALAGARDGLTVAQLHVRVPNVHSDAVRRAVQQLREERRIYRSGWRREDGGLRANPVYSLGAHEDAPLRGVDKELRRQRERESSLRRRQANNEPTAGEERKVRWLAQDEWTKL